MVNIMNKKNYQELVDKITPKEDRLKNCLSNRIQESGARIQN